VLLGMYEKFSGCKILSYCLMITHLHVLLEVPPGCEKGESLGLSEEELFGGWAGCIRGTLRRRWRGRLRRRRG
jgi:hypothetical protein